MNAAHMFSGLIALIVFYFANKTLNKWGVGESSPGAKGTKTLILALGSAALSLFVLFLITGDNPLT